VTFDFETLYNLSGPITVAGAEPADCVPVAATDPLYILYTSGTTARPKGVVRDNGGHAVALRWSMQHIYDTHPGEVFWAASDIGWVVGHSYIVYAPLFHGCTTILYEGKPVGTPDPGAFWRVVVPLAFPGLAAAASFAVLMSYNEVFAASILTIERPTLPALVLNALSASPDPYKFAAAWLLMIPTFVFIFIMRRYILGFGVERRR